MAYLKKKEYPESFPNHRDSWSDKNGQLSVCFDGVCGYSSTLPKEIKKLTFDPTCISMMMTTDLH